MKSLSTRLLGPPFLTGVLACIALAAACGSGKEPAEVEPIDSIIAGPIEVTDVSAGSAVVRVQTIVEVVCSVVYGVDTDYGQQSTDLDMAGQGHRTHSAALLGLAPDTVYHYRLQGSGPDGTLYMSKDMTFRTPEESAAAERINLASLSQGARIVEASSQFGGSDAWRPENAIDGDSNTEWSSAGDGDAAFITVELAELSEIGSVGIWTRTMGSSAEITSFKVITEDGEELGPFDLPSSNQMYEFEASVTAQRLRFEVVSSSGGNTGLVELGVYAPQ